MFELTAAANFSAAHHLPGYNGACANIHGHNYIVETTVQCTRLDETGIGIDLKILKGELAALVEKFDHKNLNDLDIFQSSSRESIPSSENIARYIFEQMKNRIGERAHVSKVIVRENSGSSVAYMPEV